MYNFKTDILIFLEYDRLKNKVSYFRQKELWLPL